MTRDVVPARRLRGVVRTPGDKSISHRALMLAALADGPSSVTGASNGEDVAATAVILGQLGAKISHVDQRLVVVGPASGLQAADETMDCGNSGTTMRLMTGLLGSVPGIHHLTGDSSLQKRPMDRVARPLGTMGLMVTGRSDKVLPPLVVTRGAGPLRAIEYAVPEPSAQVKSAILLAALSADGPCVVTERLRTRSNTEEMLLEAGVVVRCESLGDGRKVTVTPSRPKRHDWIVPSDPSQAAFFLVLALLHPDAVIDLPRLYNGAERLGFLTVLERMGANIERQVDNGLLNVTASSSELHATTVQSSEIPSVDEVPILAVAAAAARGDTRFCDVGELRIKESNRLTSTISLLDSLGVRSRAEGDDLVVSGVGSADAFTRCDFEAQLDHRMIMSAAIAATAGAGGTLRGSEAVGSSYPTFFDDLAMVGQP